MVQIFQVAGTVEAPAFIHVQAVVDQAAVLAHVQVVPQVAPVAQVVAAVVDAAVVVDVEVAVHALEPAPHVTGAVPVEVVMGHVLPGVIRTVTQVPMQ